MSDYGKELLKAYYKQIPEKVQIYFENQLDLKEKKVLKKRYQFRISNKYLTVFAIFLF